MTLSLVPFITETDPNNGTAGTIVTLTGNNFASSGAKSITVLVAGVVVPTTIVTSVRILSILYHSKYCMTFLELSFVVPVGTGKGTEIKVRVDGRTSQAATWDYSPPSIDSITPLEFDPAGSQSVTLTVL